MPRLRARRSNSLLKTAAVTALLVALSGCAGSPNSSTFGPNFVTRTLEASELDPGAAEICLKQDSGADLAAARMVSVSDIRSLKESSHLSDTYLDFLPRTGEVALCVFPLAGTQLEDRGDYMATWVLEDGSIETLIGGW